MVVRCRSDDTLLIGTRNRGKAAELAVLLEGLPWEVKNLADFPEVPDPVEDGETFEANAVKKAAYFSDCFGVSCVADDSGLVVPAINGAPGLHSARYAGNNATDSDNRKKLLDAMQHVLDDDRSAYFECWLVLASPQGVKKTGRGTCEGKILMQERGGGGFGYDPLFVKHEYSKSFAELEESVKNRISHRRKAFDKILPTLESLVEESACIT